MHTARRLLDSNHEVIGIDNINGYYDTALKLSRLDLLSCATGFDFHKADITNIDTLEDIIKKTNPSVVIHLAAQAGVRYSLTNPHEYLTSNLVGFGNILEVSRHHRVEHLIYASSSSVYGGNDSAPYRESDEANHPISLYAATKRANELMAHSYSHLYGLPTTGLRFFTVYGPWGRPDMAPMLFASAITSNNPIKLYNNGDSLRDFTYIDDVVSRIEQIASRAPTKSLLKGCGTALPHKCNSPYRIYNIVNNQPTTVSAFLSKLECALGKKGSITHYPLQAGDVPSTHGSDEHIRSDFGDLEFTPLDVGIPRFASWFQHYSGATKLA